MLSSIVIAYQASDFVKGLFSNDGITTSIDLLNAPDLTIVNATRGSTSFLSIKVDVDGKYYRTQKGEWILKDGVKILASVIAPQLCVSVKNSNWEVSTNSEASWTDTSIKAVGDGLLSVDGIMLTDKTL